MPFLQEKNSKKDANSHRSTVGRRAACGRIFDWIPGRVWQAIDAASATRVRVD